MSQPVRHEPYSPPKSPKGYKLTTKAYASLYKRSEHTIAKWKQQGAPLDDEAAMVPFIAAKNLYSSAPSAQSGLTPQHKNNVQMGKAEKYRDLNDLKAEKLEIDIEAAQLKLDVEKGKYVLQDKVREDGVRLAASLDGALKSLEGEMPSLLAGLNEMDVQREVHTLFIKLREDLKTSLSKLGIAAN